MIRLLHLKPYQGKMPPFLNKRVVLQNFILNAGTTFGTVATSMTLVVMLYSAVNSQTVLCLLYVPLLSHARD